MRARQLEVFCALMRAGTVTGAAAALNISQPALSQILLHAEDQLGFKLFNRVKGRLVATEEALELYPEAERVFGELAALRRRTADMRHGRTGLVRLAASAPPAMALVPDALAAFRHSHPNVVVRSQIAPVRHVVELLRDGEVALGIVMNDKPHQGIDVEKIGESELTCLVPKNHSLAARQAIGFADLANEALIAYHPEVLPGLLLSAIADAEGIEYAPSIEIDVSMSALPFVQSDQGIAIVDRLLPWDSFHGVTMIPFVPRTALPVAILTRTDHALGGAAATMREELCQAWARYAATAR
ncbi:LysR family transcriptional regulator [Jiella mangrovi]|uniref:LysR family transcriptional regulator n=1 Tax=Jiella mangrovi TaxID=2821407 RepID=A0ABS4BHY3_9HYPH|nr:LysR family transcriptional regulator [Jiella mangrovi]MBP0616365.1 LysR family transcriptional regulator [Jiella mangrovi]